MLAALFGNHRGARTISLALVAGLVAFEAALVLGASAVGIPGIFLVHFTSAEAETGGESVIAKSRKVEAMPESAQAPVQPSLPAPAVTDSPALTDIAALTSLPDDTKTQSPAEPRVQESREPSTGFRVRFAGSACADQITLTLKFDDGQTRKVAIDGCKLSG